MKKIFLSLFTMLSFNLAQAREFTAPQFPMEYESVTVKITNLQGSSGGTGVVLESNANTSFVLTNKHVCKLIEAQNGIVESANGIYTILKFKESNYHDVCVVAVAGDLHANTKVSNKDVQFGDRLSISGHPSLFPIVLSEGSASKNLIIPVLIGTKPCTKGDYVSHPLDCIFLGGIPNVVQYEALLATNLISPGNSGSGVFNAEGEIVGLVFAGSGELSRAFIVPRVYIAYFLQHEIFTMDWKVYGDVKSEEGATNTESSNLIKNNKHVYVIAIEDSGINNAYNNIPYYKNAMKTPKKGKKNAPPKR